MTSNIFLTPAARFNPLVRSPRFPNGVYAWGVQMNHKTGPLGIMLDVTTDTSLSFQDENTFNGLESSLRVSYEFNSHWSLSGNLGHDFDKGDSLVGVDLGYKTGPFGLRLVGYNKWDDCLGDTLGIYSIATYDISHHLEAHAGLDLQNGNGSSQTVGFRYFFTEDRKIDARLDYIRTDDFGPKENVFVAGLRWRF